MNSPDDEFEFFRGLTRLNLFSSRQTGNQGRIGAGSFRNSKGFSLPVAFLYETILFSTCPFSERIQPTSSFSWRTLGSTSTSECGCIGHPIWRRTNRTSNPFGYDYIRMYGAYFGAAQVNFQPQGCRSNPCGMVCARMGVF